MHEKLTKVKEEGNQENYKLEPEANDNTAAFVELNIKKRSPVKLGTSRVIFMGQRRASRIPPSKIKSGNPP